MADELKETSEGSAESEDVKDQREKLESAGSRLWFLWLIGFDCLAKLLTPIADNDKISGRSDIQKLLFNDNGKDVTRVLLCRNREIVSFVLKYLSTTDQLWIKKYITEISPDMIDELFQPSWHSKLSNFKQQALRYWVTILPFYDERKEKKLFGKLFGTLLLLRILNMDN